MNKTLMLMIMGNSKVLPVPPIGTPLESYTWAEIGIIAAAGMGDTYFNVGDEKNIVVNGETLAMQIYAFDHDDKSDASGKANITFGTKHLMATKKQMNATNTNVGGWTSCTMRTWANGTLYGYLDAEIQAVLKTVDKLTTAGNQSATINTTEDNVFLLSEIECFGTATNSKAGEGTKYDIFIDNTSRVKKLSNGAGAANAWWHRSPMGTSSSYFCATGGAGSNSYTDATDLLGVAFGFCV